MPEFSMPFVLLCGELKVAITVKLSTSSHILGEMFIIIDDFFTMYRTEGDRAISMG